MAIDSRPSRTIENPLIGDKVTFVMTGKESKGDCEVVQVELMAGGGTGLHYHRSFIERFEALEGELYIECDGRTIILKSGESASAPKLSLHRFYNPGNTPILFRVTIIPARRFETTLRIAYGLARDGRTTSNGTPKNLLELAVMLYASESYLKGIPIILQRAIYRFLYQIAKLTGVEKRLVETYCE